MPERVKVQLSKAVRRVRLAGNTPPSQGGDAVINGDLDQLLEEAYRDGYGRATQEWSARLTEVLRSLDREAAELNQCRCSFMESLEKNVIDLGIAVAEKYILSERERGQYCITTVVRKMMEQLEHRGGRLTVALNPQDFAALDPQAKLDEEGAFETVRVVVDPEIPLAGCRLDTGLGRVVFSLEEQMEEIRQVLEEMEVPEYGGCGDELGSPETDAQPVGAG